MKKTKIHATLVFPINKDNKILLGKKTRKVATGLYTGYGGKIEGKQTEINNVKSELFYESGRGLRVYKKDLVKMAVIRFILLNDDKHFEMIVHVYLGYNCTGTISDSEEMIDHQWFDVHEIPYDDTEQILPDYKYFLPRILNGELLAGSIKTVNGNVIYDDIYPIDSKILNMLSYKKLKP